MMDENVREIFARLRDASDFADADVSNVNACGHDGDNALHYVVRAGDMVAAEALIDAGIELNKAGDLGFTPLHVACMRGNLEMVKLLVNRGADLFALNEGVPPFTIAREAGQSGSVFVGALLFHWIGQFLTWGYYERNFAARVLFYTLACPFLLIGGEKANEYFLVLATANSVFWATISTYVFTRYVLRQ